MKTIQIYTNGKSLFTLKDYSPVAGVCHVNGIVKHSVVDQFIARAMHSKGNLHYIHGIGDTKELSNVSLSRKMNLKNFQIF